MPSDLQSRNLVLARVNLQGGITQRRYALPSRNLLIERVALDGRFTSRVYSHASRDLVVQRVALGGTLQGAVVFPEYVPTAVQFTPPERMLTEHKVQSGENETHLWGDGFGDAVLELEYDNISDAKAHVVLNAWDLASTYARNLQLPVGMLMGLHSDLAAYMLRGGLNTRWYFAEVPNWVAAVRGYGKLKVTLVSRSVAISSAVGGNVAFPVIPAAPDSTVSFNDCDFLGRDPDLELFIPPSWVRQRRSVVNVNKIISVTDANGNVFAAVSETVGGVTYLSVTKFSTAGQQLWSKTLNRTSGFANQVFMHNNGGFRALCVGPQGVVVVASMDQSFTNSTFTHKLICLSRATGELRWAKAFRSTSGDARSYGTLLWANDVTGHTYYATVQLGGVSGLILVILDANGELTACWNLGIPSVGFGHRNVVERAYTRTDGSFILIASHIDDAGGGSWVPTFDFVADGTAMLRPMYYFSTTGNFTNLVTVAAADGRIVIGGFGDPSNYIINADGTAVIGRAGQALAGGPGNASLGIDGNYYVFQDNVQQSATLWVVSSDLTQRMSERYITLGNPGGIAFIQGATDFNTATNVNRFVVTAGNWGGNRGYGVISFEMFNTSYQYPCTPAYAYLGGINTVADFKIHSTTPVALTTSAPVPTMINSSVTPPMFAFPPFTLTPPIFTTYSVTIEDDTTTIWDFYTSP